MKISLIVAADEDNGIGKDNQLPWYLPADLKHFKNLTTGHQILMGRKTYESIGKPLPNRRNIVISRQADLKLDGAEVCSSLADAIALCDTQDEVFIIGGAQIFNESFPIADALYLTRIHHQFKADTFLQNIDHSEWVEVTSETHKPDDKNQYSYTFIKYIRP